MIDPERTGELHNDACQLIRKWGEDRLSFIRMANNPMLGFDEVERQCMLYAADVMMTNMADVSQMVTKYEIDIGRAEEELF